MLEDPKLAPSDILPSVETSLEDASSRETMLDSAPIPSGTEDQGHEIESSAPLDYEHPQEARLASIDLLPVSSRNLRSSKVPSSRLGRLFHYGVTGLAASLSYGAASEISRRSTTSDADATQSVTRSKHNPSSIRALPDARCRPKARAIHEHTRYTPHPASKLKVMKNELADECDYSREASFLKRYGAPECLGEDTRFRVPWVWPGSTASASGMLLPERYHSRNGMRLHLELSSSAYGSSSSSGSCKPTRTLRISCGTEVTIVMQLSLVDFGATREYKKEFMDNWLRLLQAAAFEDRTACAELSRSLGYLTGEEHEPFSFGPGTPWTDITARIRANIPMMFKHMLTPPPRETYSLNRKLSGAFLLALRLRAIMDTKKQWDLVVGSYKFG
ncbi:hypothetical protein M405DRAFT_847358 [Rhizopogon salebrosus TDB-379]|nr:hypothetical protein M405DRAFT_847358 [Rhizopogon salebrosus TDB-379]